MTKEPQNPPQTSLALAEILIPVLLRYFIVEKTENGEEKTGISPESMAPQQHH